MDYKVVSSGQLSYGFTEDEARQELARRFKFSATQLDKLLTTPKLVLKSGVDEDQGKKLIAGLREAGLLCDLVEETEPTAAVPAAAPAAAARPQAAPATKVCPKCGASQPAGDTCAQCGIIFTKYQRQQERLATGETGPMAGPAAVGEEPPGFAERHPEKAFLLRAALTVAGLLLVMAFAPWLIAWVIFLFPLGFLLVIRFQAAAEGVPAWELLRQHITFMPVMYAEGERRREGVAWVTYGLILLNVLIFYGYELHCDPDFMAANLFFLPHVPNSFNVPIGLLAHMFLHASDGHLWGNMVFLWVFGTVIEKRVGALWYILLYLVSGVAAALVGVAVPFVTHGVLINGLGASGAIAGVMGLFAVRCYFKSVVFPIPILGVFSLIFPINLKMRLNSLVLIALFFIKDLYMGVGQVAGVIGSNVNHWAHLGGTVTGIGLAYLLKLGTAAVEEKHLELGLKATAGGRLNAEGETSLRRVLATDPDNTEALTALARASSKYAAAEEGETLYLRAIRLLLGSRPEAAAELFREFFHRYMKGMEAPSLYRLAGIFHRQQDLSMASQVLTLITDDRTAPPELREKALFQNARMLEQLGEDHAARNCYAALLRAFPESAHKDRARAALASPV